MFDGKLLVMDQIAIHPELNRADAVSHRLDVHNPPDHYWAEFRELTKSRWDPVSWEIGRHWKGKFSYINLETARGMGVSYGWRRKTWNSTLACLTDKHITLNHQNVFIQIPLDSTGTPTVESWDPLDGMIKAFPPNQSGTALPLLMEKFSSPLTTAP